VPLTYQQAREAIRAFGDPYLTAITGQRPADWGLEGVGGLLEVLGDPHLTYPTIHVAGTKGKGSTAAFITQGLIESGLRTGLYSSPHLEDWRERVQIDRAWIAEDQVVSIVEDLLPYAEDYPQLTAFEVTTALALWHFAREGCEAAVIEVGLGGALDATNVVTPVVSVITNISLDHTQILGDSISEIARDKAKIIKPGIPAVTGPQPPEALAEIRARAEEVNSELHVVGEDWTVTTLSSSWDGSAIQFGKEPPLRPYHVGMPGLFQVENAGIALATLHLAQRAGLRVTEQGRAEGLDAAHWPARMEIVNHAPTVILDGAHNAYSVERLVESLQALNPEQRFVFVFGCMADKNIPAMLGHLLPLAERLILTKADTPRATAPQGLAAIVAEVGDAQIPPVTLTETVSEAITTAIALDLPHDICVLGSLAVAGEARTQLLGNTVQ
jgi:dihydrofolate synthase/folylpolyglutamate synthase